MSEKCESLVFLMVSQLSTCKYMYMEIVRGCYEAMIYNYGADRPEESKEFVCEKVLEFFRVQKRA